MVSITIPLEDNIPVEIERFPWVNWSEVARENALKKEIFDRFIKGEELSKSDEEFCEEMNWDPIDWLEVREEYVKKIKGIMEGPHSLMDLGKLDKLLDIE